MNKLVNIYPHGGFAYSVLEGKQWGLPYSGATWRQRLIQDLPDSFLSFETFIH